MAFRGPFGVETTSFPRRHLRESNCLSGFRTGRGSGTPGALTSSRATDRTASLQSRTRRVLVKKPQGSTTGPQGSVYLIFWQGLGAPGRGSFGIRRRKRRKEEGGRPLLRSIGERFGEVASKAHESIGLCGVAPRGSTVSGKEQGPGVAGHLDLLVLRAEEWDVRNDRRARAPKGVPLCRRDKLWRVNPMSGTGPRGREVRRE